MMINSPRPHHGHKPKYRFPATESTSSSRSVPAVHAQGRDQRPQPTQPFGVEHHRRPICLDHTQHIGRTNEPSDHPPDGPD
jgi:hypothetical protein